MKYIALHNLIPKLAANLEKNFTMNKKEICSYLTQMLEGIANQATVKNNLGKEFKKRNEKMHCPKCNKRINKNMRSISQHNHHKHREKKLAA